MCDKETKEQFDSLHQKVDALHKRIDNHEKEEAIERKELFKAIELNTKAVADVATSVEGVVSAYNDLQATVRVGSNIQKALIWIGKWGVIGTAIAASMKWIIDHLPHS